MARVAKISNRSAGKMRGRKVKTWAKGHSSDSNPKMTKFRDMAAKSRFVINEETKKNAPRKKVRFDESSKILTKNENLLEKLTLNDKEEEDDEKSSVESAETNFTTFTNCTNATFNKVHRLWTSGSDLQNEVLAVLAAVADVLKSSGEQETEIAYFSALSNSLASSNEENLKISAATTYLLSLVIKKVSRAVLQSCFSTLSPIFCGNLSVNSQNPDSNALHKYTIECLGFLLKAQNFEIWENSSLERILRNLLSFTFDRRPKIRKICQKMVSQIILGPKIHPASKICAEFSLEILSKNDDYAKNSILHFLGQCMHNFGENNFKICAEKILNCQIDQSILQFFENVFYNRPTISRELILQLIAVFYDYQPSSKNDQFTFSAWCKVQTNLHICLTSSENLRVAPKFLEILTQNLPFLEEKWAISIGVNSIKAVFEHFLPDGDKNFAENLINCLKTILNLKYMQIWPQSMEILSHFFQFCPKNRGVNFEILLKNLAELREMEENSSFLNPLSRCLGSAIKFLGPEIVLRAINLDLDVCKPSVQLGQVPNLWILPLLRQNVEKTNLEHFNREFLPKVLAINRKIGKSPDDKILQILEYQIWELLPSYCIDPQDFEENFKNIGPLLVTFLIENANLRLIILCSLRNLILKSSTPNQMANYAENFLPIIINLFISDNELMIKKEGYDLKGVRQACVETLRIFLKITPRNLIARFLNLAITKFDQFPTVDQKHRCLDILIALSIYLSNEEMSRLWQFLRPFFQHKDKSLQKKAYRVLEECFKKEHSSTRIFFDENREEILAILNSNNQTSSATKASKIRCLNKLFENDFLDATLLLEILPEIILHLQELNVKTRRSAAIFFINASNLIIDKFGDLEIVWEKLCKFFDSENPDHVICCLIAARLFIFEFKHQVPGSILSQFFAKIQILLQNSNRKIVQSCLEFLKTFIVFSTQIQLGQYLEIFLPSIYRQNEDFRHHFRFLIRKILAKLLRRVPYELVCKFLPDDATKKQLNNVKKALQRYEKKKIAAKEGATTQQYDDRDDDVLSGVTGISRPETIADLLKDDQDSSDDESDQEMSNFDQKSSKKSQIFLRETADEILDFTDLKSVTKMSSRKMWKNEEKMDKNRGFKVDGSGRLIIGGENKEEIEEKVIKLSGKRRNVDGFDEIFHSDDEISNKKRPKSTSNLVADEEQDSDLDEALHYRPGGRGIHRNLASSEKSPGRSSAGGQSGKSSSKNALQPYAYVPLDFKQLNKRKRAKAGGQFRNLLQGAKKGAKKASKKLNMKKR